MNKQERNKLTMMKAWLSFMQKNRAKWETVEPIVNAYNRVYALVEEIKETVKDIDNPNAGEQELKEMLQEKVIVNGHKLFSYIYAYAEDVKNTKLKEKVDISVSTMRNLRDAELTPKINKVLDMIAGLENEIAPYGATPQKIDALKNQMNEFEEQLPSTRNNKSSVKSANGKLRAAMKEAIDLLQSRIDKLMMRFEEDDPAFYTEHLANRKVVDYGRRYEEPEETDEQKTDLVK